MKRIFLLLASLLVLVGCSKEKQETNETVKYLQENGLNEDQSKSYYVYINSIYLGFMSLENIDKSLEEKKFEISSEEYQSVMTPFNTAADMIQKFKISPKKADFDDYLLYDLGPSGILKHMEEHKRNMSYIEKGALVKTINEYTEDLVDRLDITQMEKERLLSLYEETVFANNNFYEVNEDLKSLK